jgi:transposase-like protein
VSSGFYLYRALDKRGDTIDFYRSPTQSTKAAQRFLGKPLKGLTNWELPHMIMRALPKGRARTVTITRDNVKPASSREPSVSVRPL